MPPQKRNFADYARSAGRVALSAYKGYKRARKGVKMVQQARKAWNVKSKSRSKAKGRSRSSKTTKQIVAVEHGFRTSTNLLKYKKPKGVASIKFFNLSIYNDFFKEFAVANVGTQGVSNGNTLCGGNDLIAAFTQILNQTPSATSENKIYLKSCNSDFWFRNVGETDCYLIIWDCLSKVTKVGGISPKDDWTTGLNMIPSVGAATTGYAQVDEMPTNSKIFNIAWKITKTTKVVLAPGTGHKHRWIREFNRVIDSAYPVNYGQIRGITCHTMYSVRGGPIDDHAGSDAVGTITTAPVKLIATHNVTYRFTPMSTIRKVEYSAHTPSTAASEYWDFNQAQGLPTAITTDMAGNEVFLTTQAAA